MAYRKGIHIKDPGSALTHGIGFVCAAFIQTPALFVHAAGRDRAVHVCFAVFAVSMMLLYAASTIYHTLDISEKVNRVLRKIDHMMIFVLIAGTYVPTTILMIGGRKGTVLLIAVCSLAVLGMLMKSVWITCPKWLSSVIYIALGWSCVFVFPELIRNLPIGAFLWLLAGGLFYTVGGVLYALRFRVFGGRFRYFGSHELFHCFVMAGSFCHYVCIFLYA